MNLFLYDVRQSEDHKPIDWDMRTTEDGRTWEARPPLRLAASYAVTAWTREVEDNKAGAYALLVGHRYGFPLLACAMAIRRSDPRPVSEYVRRWVAPPDLPPPGRRLAIALSLWAVSVSLLYLFVRELGRPLVP